jgi:DNA-directed RNA polymerase subunit beta'
MPNPVMEEPIRRLLGLKVREFNDIVAGREELDGLTGGLALQKALGEIDIDKSMDENRRVAMSARGAKRDDAVKSLRYLHSVKQQGLNPQDWIITKVPVLPAIFRPVSQIGDIVRASDMNGLYRDLIETNNSIKELRNDLPESALASEKEQLYNAVTASFGLGDPVTPEGVSKRWKGAIRQVIGTSPKTGLFQSKVLSKTVDVVGRGVVAPDPTLDMDSIGIPEAKAWVLYKPFVTRRLIRRGFPPVQAARMVEDQSPEAADEMLKEMNERPVLMDRAPTWHRFNLLAFKPKLVKEDVIRVSPLIVAGFNMDFDGDQANFHVPVSDKAVAQAKDKMMPSKNLFRVTNLRQVQHSPGKEMVMGLYHMTRSPSKKAPVRFANVREMKEAYKRGEIGINDKVVIDV